MCITWNKTCFGWAIPAMPLGWSYLQNLNLCCNITLITIALEFLAKEVTVKKPSDAKQEHVWHQATQRMYKTSVSLSLQDQEAMHVTYIKFFQSNFHVTWLYNIWNGIPGSLFMTLMCCRYPYLELHSWFHLELLTLCSMSNNFSDVDFSWWPFWLFWEGCSNSRKKAASLIWKGELAVYMVQRLFLRILYDCFFELLYFESCFCNQIVMPSWHPLANNAPRKTVVYNLSYSLCTLHQHHSNL